MARPIRVEYAGVDDPVTPRGNERTASYRDHADRLRFLETVEEAVPRFGVVVQAYCRLATKAQAGCSCHVADAGIGRDGSGR